MDTPIRQPVIIPERYIEPLGSDGAYLQSSPEICMKRLLAAGCTKIFQICPCFRKNESGRRHLEEFTMLEWYHSGANYHTLMEDCEALLRYLVEKLYSDEQKSRGEPYFKGLSMERPWERLTVADAFVLYGPCTVEEALKDNSFDELLVEYIEPYLGADTPTFLIDYPVELGSLAKGKDGHPAVVERFELYLGGVELANGFSELTDEVEQRRRFAEEIEAIHTIWQTDAAMPERFLADLKNIDSAAGIALGVDRLFMLAHGLDNIAEVVSFCPNDFQ